MLTGVAIVIRRHVDRSIEDLTRSRPGVNSGKRTKGESTLRSYELTLRALATPLRFHLISSHQSIVQGDRTVNARFEITSL